MTGSQGYYQCFDVLQIGLSKVSNDIIKVLKCQRVTAWHLDGEGGAQLEMASYPSCLLAALSNVLVQEQSIAIRTCVQLQST